MLNLPGNVQDADTTTFWLAEDRLDSNRIVTDYAGALIAGGRVSNGPMASRKARRHSLHGEDLGNTVGTGTAAGADGGGVGAKETTMSMPNTGGCHDMAIPECAREQAIAGQ